MPVPPTQPRVPVHCHVVLGTPEPANEKQAETIPRAARDMTALIAGVKPSQLLLVFAHVIVEALDDGANFCLTSEQLERRLVDAPLFTDEP